MTVGVGGLRIGAVEKLGPGKFGQDIGASRPDRARRGQHGTRFGAIVIPDMHAAKVELQIDAGRGEREGLLDHPDRLANLAGVRKLARQLLERGQIGRTACCGSPQLRQSIASAPRGTQHMAEQRLDFGIAIALRGFLQRRNRLLRALLAEQGMGEDQHGIPVGAI